MDTFQMLTGAEDVYLLESDVEYDGPYDILTGRPLQEAADTVQEASINDTVSYDLSANMFRYPTSDGESSVYASVAPNMVTTQAVSIVIGEKVDAVLYRDGERLDESFSEPFKLPGKYDLVVEQVDTAFPLLSFTIVQPKTGALSVYQMPSGFYVTEVVRNDETQQIRQAGMVDLTTEGTYEITYRCSATNIDYHLDIEVDHTPPAITLEGATDGVARGPVTITGLEGTDTVALLFNGESVRLPDNATLISPGDYQIAVTDDAGNTVQEDLTIRMYLNSQGLIFSVLAIALVVALVVYVYILRKRLRVQ